jgi:dienelactone hydrolase
MKAWFTWFGLAAVAVRAGESNWQIPPLRPGTNPPVLISLLDGPGGMPITTKRDWLAQRARLKERWQKVLGDFPDGRVPLKTEVGVAESLPEFTRRLVKYQVEDGVFADGYLLTPKEARGKSPAIVVFHPTAPLQAKGVAGLTADYDEEKRQGVQLVKRGYVVWCPRNYINTDGADWAGNARRVLAQHPNWTGMTRMVWDAISAVDFLETLPAVEPKRIGCLGHSLGGKEVLYAMAFDERYRAGVSSEGGIGLKFSNWDASWYLGAKIRERDFALENHQVLALVAPRAFLLLVGDSADGDRSWNFIEAVRPVYKLFGAEGNIGWLNHHLGHRYPPEAREAAEEFLDKYLK